MAEKNRTVNILLSVLLVFCILNFILSIWLVRVNITRAVLPCRGPAPMPFNNVPPAPIRPAGEGENIKPDMSAPMSELPPGRHGNPAEQARGRHRGMAGMSKMARRGKSMHGRMQFSSWDNVQIDSPEMQSVLNLLAEYYPEWRDIIEQYQKTKGRASQRMLRRRLWKYWPKIVKLAETYRYDPELTRKLIEDSYLRNQADKLANEYHQANNSDEKKRIKRELLEILSRQFEVRQWIRERKLSNLEKRINQLKKELRQRLEKRDELIQHQLMLRISQDSQEQYW